MSYSLGKNCTKNYYNRTLTLQVIIEDVHKDFFETQCRGVKPILCTDHVGVFLTKFCQHLCNVINQSLR